MNRLSFGVGLFPTEPLPAMIHLAQRSEALGFSHVWVGDSHLIWREAYVHLAAAWAGSPRPNGFREWRSATQTREEAR